MTRIKVGILFLLLLSASCHIKAGVATVQSWSEASTVLGHPLIISSSPRFAGAICSVIWNGKEFINQHDHGRLLQSAASFDGLGECYNPTEGGSAADSTGDSSTSKLLYFNVYSKQIKSATQMAFWTSVNQYYPAGCGGNAAITTSQNLTRLSECILTKHLTVGYAGISNAIEYIVTFHVPEHHSSATFESVTGYLAQDFSSFYTFDAATQSLQALSAGPGEQHLPVVLATEDSAYAMGVYSPDLPQASNPNVGYGRFNFLAQQTVKWNAVFRRGDTPAGDYTYRVYVVIGSLTDVTTGMTSVYRKFHP